MFSKLSIILLTAGCILAISPNDQVNQESNPTASLTTKLYLASTEKADKTRDLHPTNKKESTGIETGSEAKNDTDKKESSTIEASIKTDKPVIGVLTQVLRDYKKFSPDRHFHLAASYVKWLESAGARVLPILLNEDDDYYAGVFKQTNGLLFPGGDNLLDPEKKTPMMEAARKLFKLANEANDRGDYYPIWGTCLGFELLTVLPTNKNTLVECQANDVTLTTNFVDRGRMFEARDHYLNLHIDGDYAKVVQNAMQNHPLTYHYHHKCVTDSSLAEADLENYYRALGYSIDQTGLRFVAVFEARNYPYYGVLFHPEKAAYEFQVLKGHENTPHAREAIGVSRYFVDFFVSQAQLNGHQMNERSKEFRKQLIYSYNANYTALQVNDIYEQRYLFPWKPDAKGLNSDEEYYDRDLKPGEQVYEYDAKQPRKNGTI